MTGTRPPVPEAVPVTAVPGPPLPVLAAPFSARTARHDGPALDLVCAWMRRPHVEEFWHQAWPRQRWSDELSTQLAGDHSLPVLVDHDGSPLAYVEVYRVCRDRLAEHYPHDAHDLGLHIAIGDRDRTGKGLGRALLRALADGLLAADPRCRRVVAEPDVRNAASVRAFHAAGYRPAGEVVLGDKTAALVVRPRTEDDTLTGATAPARPGRTV